MSITPEPAAVLPTLYARWMTELLGAAIPPEQKATCNDCAMCKPVVPINDQEKPLFNPDVKCCSYLPMLPNYLVGQILDDSTEDLARGRATVERRIDNGLAVTPLGLEMTRIYATLYKLPEMFGQSAFLRCPHFVEQDGGTCGIWPYRNSVCSTFFCRFNRGALGKDFWDMLRVLLESVEEQLALWCAAEGGLEESALRALSARRTEQKTAWKPMQKLPSAEDEPTSRRTLWGRQWAGREREFYRRTGALIANLRWDDVVRICGPDVRIRGALVQTAFAALTSNEIDEHLELTTITVRRTRDKSYVFGYSAADPLELPSAVLEAAAVFDGTRATSDVVRSGVIDADVVQQLSDYRVLKSADITSR